MREMNIEKKRCVDVGTEFCPCNLAVTGDCLICTRLQNGKNFDALPIGDGCDCDWMGACPYNELTQNGGRPTFRRPEFTASLVERKDYGEDTVRLILSVGRGVAQKASLPGSFVFLRRASEGMESGHQYDVPVSVLWTDETHGILHVAVRREGPKSKMLLDSKTEPNYILRGPYRNGLQGKGYISSSYAQGKKLLFVTKGIGAASAIVVMNQLRPLRKTGKLEICWLADDTKVDRNLLEEYGNRVGVMPEYVALVEPRREARLPEMVWDHVLKEYEPDVVAIMASDYYIETLGEDVRKVLPDAKLVWNNNATMCCGEGVCGACTTMGADGTILRMCKCQIN